MIPNRGARGPDDRPRICDDELGYVDVQFPLDDKCHRTRGHRGGREVVTINVLARHAYKETATMDLP